MDLMRARVALRERALLDVLDLAVRFCAAHARPYGKLALAVLAPAWVASWAIAQAGGWWLGWTAALAFSAFADAPFVALASRLVFEDDVRVADVLGASLRAAPRLAVARAAQAMALIASALVFGLPWFYLGPMLLFCVEVIVLERTRLSATLVRARRIAGARFGAALSAMVLLLALRVAAAIVADVAGRELLGSVLEVAPPPSALRVGGSWLALLGWWTVVPLIATARFFTYLDIRTRTEGWDIQIRFAAIAARANLLTPVAPEDGAVS
jgi:hypothetical protein